MKIAIFGGSFDPIHIAHEQIVYKALDQLDIQKIILVPTFLNPFKSQYFFDPKEREKLLRSLFTDKEHIDISDYEIKQNKPVPSIDTVQHFLTILKPEKIYLIIGADNLRSLHKWNNFELLKDLVTFVVFHRKGYEVKNDIIPFIDIELDIDISSTTLRDSKDLKFIPEKIKHKVANLWNKESKI
jgi:nicotinate-nucleotide adenylyltransferase